MGRCHLDGFSSGCWSGASQAMKKATASRSLSDPTTRPLYQGSDNAGRMKSGLQVKLQVSPAAQGLGFEPRRGSLCLSPTALKLNGFMRLFILVVALVIVSVAD